MPVVPSYAEKRSSLGWSILMHKIYCSGHFQINTPSWTPWTRVYPPPSLCSSSTAGRSLEPQGSPVWQHVRDVMKAEGLLTDVWASSGHLRTYTHTHTLYIYIQLHGLPVDTHRHSHKMPPTGGEQQLQSSGVVSQAPGEPGVSFY